MPRKSFLNLAFLQLQVGPMLFVGEVCSQWQKEKVNGENIYHGHVARKPLISQICMVVIFQLIRLQLTFVDNGSV